MAQWKDTQLISMKMWVWSLASISGVRSQHCLNYGKGHGYGSDLVLLWLWCRLAAVALIQPLAWEFPYATGEVALRKKKDKKKIFMKQYNLQFKSSPKGTTKIFFSRLNFEHLFKYKEIWKNSTVSIKILSAFYYSTINILLILFFAYLSIYLYLSPCITPSHA